MTDLCTQAGEMVWLLFLVLMGLVMVFLIVGLLREAWEHLVP